MNRLAEIETMLEGGEGPHARAEVGALWTRWCALNRVTMRESKFGLTHLVAAKAPGSRDDVWPELARPAFDHVRWFWGEIRPAMIVSEPYDADALPALRSQAESFGLVLHHPPNPFASFHYPGWTVFAALARPGREVAWLDEQLSYEGQPRQKEKSDEQVG